MKYVSADFIDDEILKSIPEEYVIDVIKCNNCENYDTEWTDDMNENVGFCPINDTFWFPNEYCSRADAVNKDERR